MTKLIGILLVLCSVPAFAAGKTLFSDIKDASGAKIGHVKVKQEKNGATFWIELTKATPGLHGIHVHSIGKCEGPDFKSSGGHYAMPGQMHGMDNPKGPHLGDMPNIDVAKNGKGKLHFHTDMLTVSGGEHPLCKKDGTALILHEKQDDQKSDPAGNAGSRVGCAVLCSGS